MDSSAFLAGPSSAPLAQTSSFRAFAVPLAEARDLGPAERLFSEAETGPRGAALRFAQVCLERASAADGSELEEPYDDAQRAPWDQDHGEEDRLNWILEARTWELIHILCGDRFMRASDGDQAVPERGFYQTPLSAVQDIFENDRELRELKIVREWLASQTPALHIAEVRKGYMPFSKNKLRAEKRTQAGARGQSQSSRSHAIRNLDPDAESRGDGKWDLEDAHYAKALHRTLFEYARAGNLTAAFDLARQADQPWRAASLRGAMLYYQALGSEETDIEEIQVSITGNRNRALWKKVCATLSTNASLDPYERALYATLSGQLQPVLAVSNTWEECLWAHVNWALEARIDEALEQGSESWWSQEGGGCIHTSESRSSEAASDLAVKDLFEKIKGSDKAAVHASSANPYHLIQEAIIMNQTNEFLTHIESRLDYMRSEPKRYANLVRFLAHIILFFRLLDHPLPSTTSNSILRRYVELLEQTGEAELVAMYASSLEKESAEESYAHYLKSLDVATPLAERKQALYRAKEHSLDISLVATLVVDMIFSESYPTIAQSAANANFKDPVEALDVNLSETEIRLISAIAWLTFDRSTFAAALFQTNALMRLFLSRGRVHAARSLLCELPDEVFAARGELEALTEGDQAESTHYSEFFEALSASATYAEVLSNQPEPNSASRMEMHAFKEALSSTLESAKAAVVRVLTGDWLKLDEDDDGLDDDVDPEETALSVRGREQRQQLRMSTATTVRERTEELARIRQIYIPELVLRLHFMLCDARHFLPESLGYATRGLPILVADGRHKLYLEFITKEGENRLKGYLEHVRKASIERLGAAEAMKRT